jgi:hypothetical protein
LRLPVSGAVERLDGHELDTESLAPLDESDELGLVDHVAGQDREPVLTRQRHPLEATLELIAEFAA